jgi:predicted nucleotidyltransferase
MDDAINGAAGNVATALPMDKIEAFCRKWGVVELWLFGSVLRDGDFSADSDVDVMARFVTGQPKSLIDLICAENELSDLLERPVDLVLREDIERSDNWIRREEILDTARRIYAV